VSSGSRKREEWVECKILLGVFSDEREAVLKLADGKEISVPVNKSLIRVESEPSEETAGLGRVKVRVIREEADRLLVELPGPGLTQGPRVEIPRDLERV